MEHGHQAGDVFERPASGGEFRISLKSMFKPPSYFSHHVLPSRVVTHASLPSHVTIHGSSIKGTDRAAPAPSPPESDVTPASAHRGPSGTGGSRHSSLMTARQLLDTHFKPVQFLKFSLKVFESPSYQTTAETEASLLRNAKKGPAHYWGTAGSRCQLGRRCGRARLSPQEVPTQTPSLKRDLQSDGRTEPERTSKGPTGRAGPPGALGTRIPAVFLKHWLPAPGF